MQAAALRPTNSGEPGSVTSPLNAFTLWVKPDGHEKSGFGTKPAMRPIQVKQLDVEDFMKSAPAVYGWGSKEFERINDLSKDAHKTHHVEKKDEVQPRARRTHAGTSKS